MGVHAWSSAAPRRHDSTLGVFARFADSQARSHPDHQPTGAQIMKTSAFTWLVAIGLVAVVATPVFAQAPPQAPSSATTNMEILAQKLKADKKLLVAQTVGLTDAEGKAFWPIYDAYQADLQKINERLRTGIESYAKDYNASTMTDAKAAALTGEMIAIEEALVSLKKTYVAKLNGVIPATKIARYVQVENKVRALVNFDLAAEIPFVR
jgi:hypothetical protein